MVNEDTTADALMLQKENARLRKELEMFRQLQQVGAIAQCSCSFLLDTPDTPNLGAAPRKCAPQIMHASGLSLSCCASGCALALLAEVASQEMLLSGQTCLLNGMMMSRQACL